MLLPYLEYNLDWEKELPKKRGGLGFYTICSQSLSRKSILPWYMPNRVITVFPKEAPNAISIIQRPSLGTKPRVPLCIPSYVKTK